MPSMKDIRKKIGSTKNTQQITKAMKMVSAAKLRRAQNAIVNARPYAYKVHSVISRLARSGQFSHPLMEQVENPKRCLVVVLTSDRGLCGGFNSGIIKFTDRFFKENKDRYEKLDFIFIGRKGHDAFKKREGVNVVDTITNLALEIKFPLAAALADRLMKEYTANAYDEVRLIYNEFKTAISQQVVAERLLPIEPLSRNATVQAQESDISESADFITGANYLFEPAAKEILSELLPKHFAVQVYRVMLESIASEHGARMTAMDGATRNAGQMIRKLTLTYNKLRQAAITKELMEIVSGAEALK
ncbi:MAG: ATP synthase F1 subunit gamma [Oligoflexia bacterium]|nr:ATP synthase F1 subunit gamma [Oligoflexia bacterium]